MRVNVLVLTALFFALGLLATSGVSAAIFKYTDKNGVISFASDLQSIPPDCRSTAVIISGDAKEEEEKRPLSQSPSSAPVTTPAGTASAAPSAQPTAESRGKDHFGGKALISAIVVVSGLFIFVILGTLDMENKKAERIARLVVIWGVSVYLLYAHGGDVIHTFTGMGNKIENVHRQSEEKGKKAAEGVKALNTMIEQAGAAGSAEHAESGQETSEKKE